MAYWNPFGWDEETRRSIQSIVRPVMQVASMAASMGAFSGGGGTKANTGTPAAGATPETPFKPSPTDPNYEALQPAIGEQKEWLGQQEPTPGERAAPGFGKDAPVPVDPQFFPEAKPTMNVPAESVGIDPNATGLGGPNSGLPMQGQPIKVEPHQELVPYESQVSSPEIFDRPDVQEHLKSQIRDATPEEIKAFEEGTYQGDAFKKGTAEAKPPATKTSNTPEIKPKPEDGPGPGGKEISSWADVFDKGFNWENIEKFLKSKEGRHWLLMDEKGFAGIGRKLTAAADAGVTAFNGLTPKERKKILDRLKKEREEREKERRNR